MTSEVAGGATEWPQVLDANQTWLNLTDDDTASQYFADDFKDEILFHFVLYQVTAPTVFSIIILVGLLGNLLVVVVTLSRHKMWTTVNLPQAAEHKRQRTSTLLRIQKSQCTFLKIYRD